MSATQLAVPAGDALVASAAALRAAFAADAGMPAIHEAARKTGDAWIDALLEGFLLPLAAASRGPGAGLRTAATVHDLGERVIEQAIRKADRKRVAAFVAFLDARLDGAVLRAPVDDTLAAAIAPALEGDDPEALATALHATIDAALRRFLDEPLATLGLGALTAAAMRVGRFAVARRTHREVDRAVQAPESAARLRAALAQFVS